MPRIRFEPDEYDKHLKLLWRRWKKSDIKERRHYAGLIKRFKEGRECDRFPALPEDANVLDVGSGSHPHPKATHLADIRVRKGGRFNEYPRDTVIDRPFTQCDIQEMSCFKDGEFNFVIARQILEHVNYPEKACKELMRIGKAGYITTPTTLMELLMPRPYHKWYIDCDGETLIFEERKHFLKRNHYEGMDCTCTEDEPWRIDGTRIMYFKNLLNLKPDGNIYDINFARLFHRNHFIFTLKFLWTGRFNYKVIR